MRRLVIAAVAAALLIGAAAGCGGTGSERQAALETTEAEAQAGAPVSSGQLAASPEEVQHYWTPQRIEDAEPLPVPRTTEPPSSSTETRHLGGGAETREVGGATPVVGRAAETASESTEAQSGESGSSSSSNDADFVVSATTTYPNSTVGKLFFSTPEGEALCSANVVSSQGESLIITAGHCAYDTNRHQFYSNFRFVPGYHNGAGLGTFYGAKVYVPHGWTTSPGGTDEHYPDDMAAILLYPDSSGHRVQEVAGGRAIAFNTPSATFEQFGYPGTPKPYDGQSLIGCATKFVGYQEPYTYSSTEAVIEAQPCFQGHGGSGGGWIIPRGSAGSLASVYSHFYCESNASTCGYVFGAYFGSIAEQLYNATQALAPTPPAQPQTTTPTPTTSTPTNATPTTPTPTVPTSGAPPRHHGGAAGRGRRARVCRRMRHRLRRRLPHRVRVRLAHRYRRTCR